MQKRTIPSYKISKLLSLLAKILATVVMVLVNVGYTYRDRTVPNPNMWVNWALLCCALTFKITSLILTIVLAVKTRKAYQTYQVDKLLG